MSPKKKRKNEYPLAAVLIIFAALLFGLAVFALCLGKYEVTSKEALQILWRGIWGKTQTAPEMTVNVVLRLRLPRIAAAMLVGAALSTSGTAYQGIFQNPLVSPDFLGVSSGACIGAACAILLGFTSAGISVLAFFGGIIAVLITAGIPVLLKNRSNIMLVLAGILTGSLMSSILGFLKYTADPDTQLASITYWTMGSFTYIQIEDLAAMAALIIPPMVVLILMSWWLDVLSMGDKEARSLGANVRLLKGLTIGCSTLLTAAAVCLAGTIGWVGLIIPHFCRLITGPANRRLLPASCIAGALFMLLVDTFTRVIGATEMPVSIMTGIIGAPVFFCLLMRRRGKIG